MNSIASLLVQDEFISPLAMVAAALMALLTLVLLKRRQSSSFGNPRSLTGSKHTPLHSHELRLDPTPTPEAELEIVLQRLNAGKRLTWALLGVGLFWLCESLVQRLI